MTILTEFAYFFEIKGYFAKKAIRSSYSVIVQVSVILKRTVVGD